MVVWMQKKTISRASVLSCFHGTNYNKSLMQTNKNGYIDFLAILPVSSFRRFVLVIRKIQLGAPSNLNSFMV